MCGIAGFYDNSLSGADRANTLETMLSSIAHRGPDYRGVYFDENVSLGHNRLSILDLSSEGNQPMSKYGLTCIYNGEVYNYVEIKSELENAGFVFQSKSDTEVILTAYKRWGVSCVDRFIGMWAFCIWDEVEKKLFCSRDRFGIKPFYYIYKDGKFYFASEYKALKSTPVFSSDLNLNQVARALQLGWCTYHDETFFNCIKQIEPGCNLILDKEGVHISKYWELQLGRCVYNGHEEAVTDFGSLLRDSVRIHMRSDVDVAVCLSGGIDSSSLTGLITDVYPDMPFNTFSIYYDGDNEVDERPFIDAVVKKYPQITPYYFKPTDADIEELFFEVVDKSDVPITGSSPMSHYYLVKKIHQQGIKVVLDGQGADEYLGGYNQAYYRRLADFLKNCRYLGFVSQLIRVSKDKKYGVLDTLRFTGKSVLSAVKSEESLFRFEFEHFYPFLVKKELLKDSVLELGKFGSSTLDDYLYHSLMETSLPTILHYVDRMTMSHSVESRVPLLDHRLVDFAFSIPDSEKISRLHTKSILRESVKDLLPEAVYNRKDKKGFVTPGEEKWLRGRLKWLLDMDYKNLEWMNADLVKKIMLDYKSGDNKNARLVWRLAVLNYWVSRI